MYKLVDQIIQVIKPQNCLHLIVENITREHTQSTYANTPDWCME